VEAVQAIDELERNGEASTELIMEKSGALQRLGDPYVVSVFDLDGRVGIDYGVYGVPETYIIDKEGVIRFKQVGAVTLETLQSQILPLVQKLNAS
jgi:cytochrome c biogenesis protein CcmG/thiol:disulfide interchange protein DsbE